MFKRLYIFMLKTFIPLFAMTFFIVLFIVLMQFLWKYIDDLVGKGLEMSVMAELFFYAAVSLIPTALPLAILLASLMTFGNLGEKFELTAMKAAGISLLRTMAPLIVFVSGIAVGAFYFQNDVLPKAQVKMWTLLFSMRQKSPEIEIPEKVFYDQIPGYNLYIDHKDKLTGKLYDVMIYDVSKGQENATILRADSAKMSFTKDMAHLYLHMWYGEQFDNLANMHTGAQNVPFRREIFDEKQILISFDANFNRLDEEGMRKQYVGKNIAELRHTIDSVEHRVDSMGSKYAVMLEGQNFGGVRPVFDNKTNLPLPYRPVKNVPANLNIDSLVDALTPAKRDVVLASAVAAAEQMQMEYRFKAESLNDDLVSIRRHGIELMKKFTLSVACLIFFFIGAPLGAIIRKGGLGTPLVISVILFIIYYIIDNTGYKLARDGKWPVWEGMWISTAILAPLGVYVTWKAMNDSAVFNPDAWKNIFTRIFGVRQERRIEYKEVIINEAEPDIALRMTQQLRDAVGGFLSVHKSPQFFVRYWLKGFDRREVESLRDQTDELCDYLANSRNKVIVNKLASLPVLRDMWIYHPANRLWISITAFILFPIGVPVWIAGYIKQRGLLKELRKVTAVSGELANMLNEELQ